MAAKAGWLQRRRLLDTATIWLALSLSSCAFFGFDEPATPPSVAEPPPPPPVAEISPPTPPRPARKPSPPSVQQPADQQPTDQQPAEQRPTDAPPAAVESEPVDPERIIGLGERDTENWLGTPSERSEAPPATIWRYFSKDCQVDVYFYLDLQKGVMRALTYEVRSDDIVERRPERCFQQLVGEHRRRQSNAAAIGTH